MSLRATPGAVTAQMLRECGRIYVTDEKRVALLSKDRLLPRFRTSRAEGRMSPPELQVIVRDLTREEFEQVSARLQALDADRSYEDFAIAQIRHRSRH